MAADEDRDFPKVLALMLFGGASMVSAWAQDGNPLTLFMGLGLLGIGIVAIAGMILLAAREADHGR